MAEIRRVFWQVVLAGQRVITDVLWWSHWRRQHQASAKAAHWRRRLHTSDPGRSEVTERDVRRTYPTDLTDRAWMEIAPLLPQAKPRGRPYEHAGRDLVNAYCYVMRTGRGWRMLPKEFPPWQTVHWHVTQWRRAGILAQIWKILDEVRGEQNGN